MLNVTINNGPLLIVDLKKHKNYFLLYTFSMFNSFCSTIQFNFNFIAKFTKLFAIVRMDECRRKRLSSLNNGCLHRFNRDRDSTSSERTMMSVNRIYIYILAYVIYETSSRKNCKYIEITQLRGLSVIYVCIKMPVHHLQIKKVRFSSTQFHMLLISKLRT